MSVDVKFMENYCEGWRLKERGNEAYRSGDRKRAAANYGRVCLGRFPLLIKVCVWVLWSQVFLYVNALAPDDRACEPDGYRYPDDVKLPAGALPLARRVLELRRDAYTSLALCHFLNADHDKAITCATNVRDHVLSFFLLSSLRTARCVGVGAGQGAHQGQGAPRSRPSWQA